MQPQKNSSSATSGSALRVGAKAGAHAASDPADTIADYSFSPATITVSVGDTVTWTNQGKQPHTATASDGSFNTGTLHTGQSASHTFTKAGTFAYICSIHPFMHGTVVVQGSTSGGGSSSGSGSGNGTGSSAPHRVHGRIRIDRRLGHLDEHPNDRVFGHHALEHSEYGAPEHGHEPSRRCSEWRSLLVGGGVLLRRQLGF